MVALEQLNRDFFQKVMVGKFDIAQQ